MKLSGLTWRSCEGSKRVIGPLQAGRSTRYPATIETPARYTVRETFNNFNEQKDKLIDRDILVWKYHVILVKILSKLNNSWKKYE